MKLLTTTRGGLISLGLKSIEDSFDLVSLALPHVPGLHAYTPGMQPAGEGWVKLNTNENPYPASPRVEEAIRAEAGDRLRLYPDPKSARLREAIGKHHGCDGDHVCVGNGSDDVLNLLVRCFCDADRPAGFAAPSYSLYPVLVAIQNGAFETIPFDRSMKLDVERAANCGASVLFLTSPNAPTGVGFSNETISALARSFPGLLVVDEAYADFAEENAAGLVREYPNLCVVRTFSKSYSLAGMRVGYLLGRPELVGLLDRVRDSYNVNRLSQAAALAAIEDQEYFRAIVGKIKYTRDFYLNQFRNERGWFTYPSQANFIFTEPKNSSGETGPDVARGLYEFLSGRKVLVRYFPSDGLTSNFLRITVGNETDMLALSDTIDQWLKNE